MASDPIRAALEAAARRLCICDGECFATRHGMMHGPCEQDLPRAAAAVAAFLRALPDRFPMPGAHNLQCQVWGHAKGEMRKLAAAVEAAGREGE